MIVVFKQCCEILQDQTVHRSHFFSGLRLMLPNGSEIRARTDARSETQSLIGCCTSGPNYQPESPLITPEPTWRVGSLPACTVHPLPYCHAFIATHQTINHSAAIFFFWVQITITIFFLLWESWRCSAKLGKESIHIIAVLSSGRKQFSDPAVVNVKRQKVVTKFHLVHYFINQPTAAALNVSLFLTVGR